MVINKFNLSKPNIFEFKQIVNEICQNFKVKEMTNFMQHANTSCYEHCLRVAYYTYIICKKLNLDYVSATRGAMLHDFFLYDWHEHRKVHSFLELHAFSHPKIALNNSLKYFKLNDIEKDVILKHMWPLTFKFPSYKESFIITLTDKLCAFFEVLKVLNKRYKIKNMYRYSYVVLTILLVRF